jgi:hypothetical protein
LNIALPKKISWEGVLLAYNPADPDTPVQREGQGGVHFSGKHAKRCVGEGWGVE